MGRGTREGAPSPRTSSSLSSCWSLGPGRASEVRAARGRGSLSSSSLIFIKSQTHSRKQNMDHDYEEDRYNELNCDSNYKLDLAASYAHLFPNVWGQGISFVVNYSFAM